MESEQLRQPRMSDGCRLKPSLEVVDAVSANRLPESFSRFRVCPFETFCPASQGDRHVGTVSRRRAIWRREALRVVFLRLRACVLLGRQLPQRKVSGNEGGCLSGSDSTIPTACCDSLAAWEAKLHDAAAGLEDQPADKPRQFALRLAGVGPTRDFGLVKEAKLNHRTLLELPLRQDGEVPLARQPIVAEVPLVHSQHPPNTFCRFSRRSRKCFPVLSESFGSSPSIIPINGRSRS